MADLTVGIAILAAGLSKRYGSVNKLTVPINGSPMVAHVLKAASGHKNTKMCVVVSNDDVADLCKDADVLQNPMPERGQSSSVVICTEHLSDCDGILFLPGDMPFFTHASVNRLLEVFRSDPHKIIAGFDGGKYHPVLFPKKFYPDLLSLNGDIGGRRILQNNTDEIIPVFIPADQLTDIDTP